MSSPALAQSGEPVLPVSSVPGVTEAAAAVLEDVDTLELVPLVAVDPATLLPAVPAQLTAAEPVTAGAVVAPPPEPAAAAPAQAAPDIRPSPDPPAPPTAAQTAPANVNVSVRIDSPGDNGAVVQTNTAEATAPQYQPDAPQYQESIPTAAVPGPEPEPAPDQVAEPDPAVETGEWNWTWSWNCGDPIPELPVASSSAIQSWIWNWDWNCTENAPQYQPGAMQYRPININISIRINSPGNDGAVIQTNVAVVVTPPVLTGVGSGPQQTQAEFVAVAAPTPIDASADISAAPPEQLSESDDGPVLPRARGFATVASEPQSVLLPEAPPTQRRDLSARERFRASVAVTARLAEASAEAARVAQPLRKPPRTVRPAPAPRRPVPPRRAHVGAPSAAGFAPLNAPDGRPGYLVLLVVGLALAISLADASRSVAAEVRATGEDPDPPPDRPG